MLLPSLSKHRTLTTNEMKQNMDLKFQDFDPAIVFIWCDELVQRREDIDELPMAFETLIERLPTDLIKEIEQEEFAFSGYTIQAVTRVLKRRGMSALKWHYNKTDGQKAGPMGRFDLIEVFESGMITNQTLVWREGLAEWEPYANFVGLKVKPFFKHKYLTHQAEKAQKRDDNSQNQGEPTAEEEETSNPFLDDREVTDSDFDTISPFLSDEDKSRFKNQEHTPPKEPKAKVHADINYDNSPRYFVKNKTGATVSNGIWSFIQFPFWIVMLFYALFNGFGSITGWVFPVVFCAFMILASIPIGIGLLRLSRWAYSLRITTGVLVIVWFSVKYFLDSGSSIWAGMAVIEAIMIGLLMSSHRSFNPEGIGNTRFS